MTDATHDHPIASFGKHAVSFAMYSELKPRTARSWSFPALTAFGSGVEGKEVLAADSAARYYV